MKVADIVTTARSLLLSSAVVFSACIIPPSLQPAEQSPNQQVTFVASELLPTAPVIPSDTMTSIEFRLLADDADVADTLQVRLLRKSDDGKMFVSFADATLSDAMIAAHPTWRSARVSTNICLLFRSGNVNVSAVVTDRAFANSVDETVVDSATSSQYNWLFQCQ